MRRAPTLLAFLVAAAPAACDSADPCTPGEARCEGNVLATCTGAPGGTAWQEADCGDGATCLGTRCYAGTPLPCPEGQAGHDRCNRQPETCTADGYWYADPDRACDPARGESCFVGPNQLDGSLVPTAVCAAVPGSCDPRQGVASCHNDVRITCAAAGAWVRDRDCAAEGKACQQGDCR